MNLPFSHRGSEPGGPGSEFDARPLVAIRGQDRSSWWFAGGAVIAAVLLFSALEARRQGQEQGQAIGAGTALATPEAIPELVIPAMPGEQGSPLVGPSPWTQPGETKEPTQTSAPATRPRAMPLQPDYPPPSAYAGSSHPELPPPPLPASSELAFPDAAQQSTARQQTGSTRIGAGRLENPATTVIQGTLINAVLETALDSTSPGQTRAVVTRDIHGFDGTRILIPRGSRLYGVYEANVAQGQSRAQIRWTRLLRPDGVSVALDSPAADPLGRAGVAARVNNHFMQRLGNALLGTASAVGSTWATSSIGNSPVVVAVPGAAQTASQSVVPSSHQIAPTLTVRQGTRITVFVRHDLDFTSVDEVP